MVYINIYNAIDGEHVLQFRENQERIKLKKKYTKKNKTEEK